MTQVLVLGGSSLLGHHLISLLAKAMVQVIAFLPEDEALFFVEKYPSAQLAFLPWEPKDEDQISSFMKLQPGITHIVILGPHPVPTAQDLEEASTSYELDAYGQDTDDNVFRTSWKKISAWLQHLSGRRILLESSILACDAEDSVFDAKWKVFSHRDICMVSYPDAVKSLDSCARYTDAMVEHQFWSNNRWCYPAGSKIALPVAPLTGPGIMAKRYNELYFSTRKHVPLFVDARDAAFVFRTMIFDEGSNRELVAQGRWNEDQFLDAAKAKGFEYPRREGDLLAGCDTYELQSNMGIKFRSFTESIADTMDWLSKHKDLYA